MGRFSRTRIKIIQLFLVCFFVSSCASTSKQTAPSTAPSIVEELSIKNESDFFLEQRVQKIGKLIATKENKIATLKQNRQNDPFQKDKKLIKENELINLALSKNLEKEFRAKKKEPPFQLDLNKKPDGSFKKNLAQSSLYNQAINLYSDKPSAKPKSKSTKTSAKTKSKFY